MTGTPVVLALRLGPQAASALVGSTGLVSPARSEGLCDSREAASSVVQRQLRLAREIHATVRGLAFACPAGQSWRELGTGIAALFGLPSIEAPIAVASLAGEARRSPAVIDPLALIDVDTLRLALRLHRSTYRGASGNAGDLAHLGLDRPGPVRCACGLRGCLGALVALGDDAPTPPVPAGLGPPPSKALGWLAVAGVALVNTLNPAKLVVQGLAVTPPAAFAWFAEAVQTGSLSATRAGLASIGLAEQHSALVGAAALYADALTMAPAPLFPSLGDFVP